MFLRMLRYSALLHLDKLALVIFWWFHAISNPYDFVWKFKIIWIMFVTKQLVYLDKVAPYRKHATISSNLALLAASSDGWPYQSKSKFIMVTWYILLEIIMLQRPCRQVPPSFLTCVTENMSQQWAVILKNHLLIRIHNYNFDNNVGKTAQS